LEERRFLRSDHVPAVAVTDLYFAPLKSGRGCSVWLQICSTEAVSNAGASRIKDCSPPNAPIPDVILRTFGITPRRIV
jgi:hypothetical protein